MTPTLNGPMTVRYTDIKKLPGTIKVRDFTQAMQRNPHWINVPLVLSMRHRAPLQATLARIGIAAANQFQRPELIGTEIYRYPVAGGRPEKIRILSWEGTGVAGTENYVVLSDAYCQSGANIKLADGRSLLYLDQRQVNGKSARYRVQIVGVPGLTQLDAGLMTPGAEVSYVGFSVGEGSRKGQSMGSKQGEGSTYNVMHKLSSEVKLTGSAMAEAIKEGTMYAMPGRNKNTGEPETHYYSLADIKNNTGDSLYGFHFESVDRMMRDSVLNVAPDGSCSVINEEGEPVHHMAGLRQQLEAAQVINCFTDEPLEVIRRRIFKAARALEDFFGTDGRIALKILGHRPAMRLFSDALREYEFGPNPVRFIYQEDKTQVDNLGRGYVTKYQIGAVEMEFEVIGENTAETEAGEKVWLNGDLANITDFEMWLIPVIGDSQGRPSLHVFGKGVQNGNDGKLIDRSVIMGVVSGMYGQTGNKWTEVATTEDAKTYRIITDRGVALTNAHLCQVIRFNKP